MEPESESSMEKEEPRDEQFQVLMRTSESLDPARPNPWTFRGTQTMCFLCFKSIETG